MFNHILSPLSQFEVLNLIGLNSPLLGNIHISITNISLYSVIILIIIVGLHLLGNNENKIIPNKWSISLESSYASLSTMVKEQVGSEKYIPFIYSIFFNDLI